jgi:hypothetical protein
MELALFSVGEKKTKYTVLPLLKILHKQIYIFLYELHTKNTYKQNADI